MKIKKDPIKSVRQSAVFSSKLDCQNCKKFRHPRDIDKPLLAMIRKK